MDNLKINMSVLGKISRYFSDPVASGLRTVECRANVPVVCHLCGQRLSYGVPYTALARKGATSIMADDVINWCGACESVISDSAFRKALNEFIDKIRILIAIRGDLK